MKAFLLAGVCAVALATPAAAHHPGTGGNAGSAGALYTITADTLAAGGFAVGLFYEYIKLGGLSDAQLINAAAQHQHVHSIGTIQSPWLSLAYGVTDDITVSARFPYVKRTDIREGHHEHEETTGAAINTVDFRGDSAGFGDVTVLGQYRFFKTEATSTALLLGVKAPTGVTNRRDQNGELFETEFQPGSGSWDGMFGLAFSYRFAPAWQFDTNVLYILTGEGVQDTDLGDRFLYNAAVTYRLVGATPAPLRVRGPRSA
jgi:Putative MetA-pathway of phenol degradation